MEVEQSKHSDHLHMQSPEENAAFALETPRNLITPVRPQAKREQGRDPLQLHRIRSRSPLAEDLSVFGTSCDNEVELEQTCASLGKKSPARSQRDLPVRPLKRSKSHALQPHLSKLSEMSLFLKQLQMTFRGSIILKNKTAQLLHDTLELKEYIGSIRDEHAILLIGESTNNDTLIGTPRLNYMQGTGADQPATARTAPAEVSYPSISSTRT